MRTTRLAIAAPALLASAALAQFTLERATIDTGGGSVVGFTFELDATLGQPDASNQVTGTSFELTGGFWAPAGPPNPCPADFDNDGIIDGADFGTFGAAFGSMAGDPSYLPEADLNGDGSIDGADFGVFGAQFGRTDCDG
jgi:hypothetical protein